MAKSIQTFIFFKNLNIVNLTDVIFVLYNNIIQCVKASYLFWETGFGMGYGKKPCSYTISGLGFIYYKEGGLGRK